MVKILFVCHGNICRSPMAEFFMKDLVKQEGKAEQFDIASAATSTEEIGNGVHWGTRSILGRLGISCAGRETISREQSSLQQALEQSAIQAYALTGHYPLSLEELLHDYNISYDTDKFVVEYVPSGSNLLPSISVLVLSSGKGGSL